jgi:hypothetical protein
MATSFVPQVATTKTSKALLELQLKLALFRKGDGLKYKYTR